MRSFESPMGAASSKSFHGLGFSRNRVVELPGEMPTTGSTLSVPTSRSTRKRGGRVGYTVRFRKLSSRIGFLFGQSQEPEERKQCPLREWSAHAFFPESLVFEELRCRSLRTNA